MSLSSYLFINSAENGFERALKGEPQFCCSGIKYEMEPESNAEPTRRTGNEFKGETWFHEGFHDIKRLIFKLTAPYCDLGNTVLHQDELCAECWSKIARMIHEKKFETCETRKQFFALIKVSLRNIIFSIVQKHVFSEKRAGYLHANPDPQSKPFHLSINSEVGVNVAAPSYTSELLSILNDFTQTLSPALARTALDLFTGPLDPRTCSDAKVLRHHFGMFLSGDI